MSDNRPTKLAHEHVVEDDIAVETLEGNLVALSADAIPLDIPLPCSIYIKIGNQFPRFRSQGEKLDSKRLIGLARGGTRVLYVHKIIWDHYLRSLEEIELNLSDDRDERVGQIRVLLLTYGTELDRMIKEPKKPMFDKMRRLTESLATALREDPSLGASLLRKNADPRVWFVNHAVNVTIYGCLMAQKLKFSRADTKLLSYALLVHDVGYLCLPRELRYKRSSLSDEEKELMSQHPRLGAELLTGFADPPAVVQTALQHHEQIDGRGYPQGLIGNAIHPFALICAVADVYDDLTSLRPYQEPISPKEAIEKMQAMEGVFDPNIIHTVAG